VCILLVILTYVYHDARFREYKVYLQTIVQKDAKCAQQFTEKCTCCEKIRGVFGLRWRAESNLVELDTLNCAVLDCRITVPWFRAFATDLLTQICCCGQLCRDKLQSVICFPFLVLYYARLESKVSQK